MAPVTRSKTGGSITTKLLSSRNTEKKLLVKKSGKTKPRNRKKSAHSSRSNKPLPNPNATVRCGHGDFVFYITPEDLARKIKAFPHESWMTVSTWDGITDDLELKYGQSFKDKRGEHILFAGELLQASVNINNCSGSFDPETRHLLDKYSEELSNSVPKYLSDGQDV